MDKQDPHYDAPPATKAGEEDADGLMELAKAMAMAAILALFIRTFLFEPFNIPSGSMLPSLLVGDYLFVEKYSYGYGQYSFPLGIAQFDGRILQRQPERGDVAVFRQPKRPEIDYIKRIIGLPGDKIQVTEGRLYINGVMAMREYKGTEDYKDDNIYNVYSRYVETLPNGVAHFIYELSDVERLDDTDVFTIPQGHYFAMGDNRDSSQDSRVMSEVGFVPEENLVGRAAFIFFSTEGIGNACVRDGFLAALRSVGCKIISWPKAIRYHRLFKRVHSL